MKKKIAFHSNQLSFRGTETALFDYAKYNETLLKNKSIIIVPMSSIKENKNDSRIVSKFMSLFAVYFYNNLDDMEDYIADCDMLYVIKYGTNDGIFSKKIKTCIHAVFDMSQPHGNIYAGVSHALANKFGYSLFVPHMISLKPNGNTDNFRNALNIPNHTTVYGRLGGRDNFNLDLGFNAIKNIVNNTNDIYFLLINTDIFYEHPRIIYMNSIASDEDKIKFYNTIDGLLEISNFGHTFGLSIGEASVFNKPILAYNGWLWNTAHLEILGDSGIYFTTEEELYDKLINFDKSYYETRDNNCYRNYTPEKIMEIFNNVFINDL